MQQLKALVIGGALLSAGITPQRDGASKLTVTAEPAMPARVPRPGFGPKPYRTLIRALVASGVRKLFVTEDHFDKKAARATDLTVQGAKAAQDGKTVALYREMGGGAVKQLRSQEKICASDASDEVQDACADEIVDSFDRSDLGLESPPAGDKRSLKRTVREGVAHLYMLFDDPKTFDMERVLLDKRVSVVSTGLAHAAADIDWDDQSVVDSCSMILNKIPDPYLKVPRSGIESMYDGYDRAQKQGPAVMVIPGTTLDRFQSVYRAAGHDLDVRAECQASFRAKGLLVVEVALDDSLATVVAPVEMRKVFEKVAKKYPGAIDFGSQGGSGWGGPSVKSKDKTDPHPDL